MAAASEMGQSLLMHTPPVSDQVRNSSRADLVKAAYFSRIIERNLSVLTRFRPLTLIS
jgi:hypothetical protein